MPKVAEHRSAGVSYTARGPVYTRSFTVEASSESDARAVLASDSDVELGLVYKNAQGGIEDTSAVCTQIRISPKVSAIEGGTGLYDAEAIYEYPSNSLPATTRPAIQPNGPPRRWVERSLVSQVIDADINRNPLANTAGEPFEPLPTKLVVEETLVIQWIKTFTDFIAAYQFTRPYVGRINSEVYYGAPKHCLLCTGIDIDEMTVRIGGISTGVPFQLTAKFLFKPDVTLPVASNIGPYGAGTNRIYGWDFSPLNLGRRIIDGTTGRYKEIRENDADQSSPLLREPVSIATDGRSWYQGTPLVRSFQIYREIDFNLLAV